MTKTNGIGWQGLLSVKNPYFFQCGNDFASD
jgi:hypothetical protein